MNTWAKGLVVTGLCLMVAACGDDRSDTVQGYVEGDFINLGLPLGGAIVRMAVAPGDWVDTGAEVFALDATAETAAVAEAEAQWQQARARYDNLLTGKRPEEIQVLEAQQRQAHAALKLADLELKRQQGLLGTSAALVAKLDAARAAAAEARAKLAEATAQIRAAQLAGREPEIAAALSAVQAAEAALAQSRWKLAQRHAVAPLASRVEDVLFRPGEVIAAGQPAVRLLPPTQVVVRAYVSTEVVAGLHAGGQVRLQCDVCGAEGRATVGFVSGEATYAPPVLYSRESRDKLRFLVEFRPSPELAPRLRPGQPVDVMLPKGDTK